MTRRTFEKLAGVADLDRVNDAQKATWDAMIAADPALEARSRHGYLLRWREALAHARRGDRVLDIGGGYVPPEAFDEITRVAGLDYFAMDLDPGVVDAARRMLAAAGAPVENARRSENTRIPFPDGSFDFIFSSHCLEHSTDIVATLLACRRALREGGGAFVSVPLGFDLGPEHPLYLGPDEWTRLFELCGFAIVSVSIGSTRVESGDLAIMARRSDAVAIDEAGARALARRFSKQDLEFVPATEPAFSASGPFLTNPDALVLGGTARLDVTLTAPPRALIVFRHRWSGTAMIEDGENAYAFDAYAAAGHCGAIDLHGFAPRFTVRVVGRNPLSEQRALGIAGALVRHAPQSAA